MRKISMAVLVAAAATFTGGVAFAQSGDTASDITAVLDQYEAALNASDAAAVAPLYTADGVFMAPGVPAQVGTAAIEATYAAFFQTIAFDLDFTIDEIVDAGDYAFARTHSAGTGKLASDGATVPQGNQELWVFQKDDAGAWHIARYAFNSTVPAN